MPGLIDCHVHIMVPAMGGRISAYPEVLPSFQAAVAGDVLRDILMRGFTTVRDAAGADAGHREAVEQGLFTGPRLFVCGRAISQTGGHGDARSPADLASPCACVHLVGGLCRIADGVTEVRQAVRDEIRLGADQIKVMAGGGVASPADPIDQLQYSDDELAAAAVDEAGRSHTYVLVHAYTAEAIKRSVRAGARTIEHGNMIDEEAAAMMARAGAFLVPTLVTYGPTNVWATPSRARQARWKRSAPSSRPACARWKLPSAPASRWPSAPTASAPRPSSRPRSS